MNEEQQERVRFEVWYRGRYCQRLSEGLAAKVLRVTPNGEYDSIHASEAWEGWKAAIASQSADERVRELSAKYLELIMAVARKYPNETRHETALRYIRQAESSDDRVRESMLKACELRDKYSAAGYIDASYQVSDESIVDEVLAEAKKEANK